jgi:hypothetical protein
MTYILLQQAEVGIDKKVGVISELPFPWIDTTLIPG